MLKSVFGSLTAVGMIAVLTLLIVQSRSVNETYYAAHITRLNQLELAELDSESILQGLQSAHSEARAVPELVEAGFTRLRETAVLLHRSIDPAGLGDNVARSMSSYGNAVDEFITRNQAVVRHQTRLAESLVKLQSESPTVVKNFRRLRHDIFAQNVFTMTLDVLDFVTGKSRLGPANLRNRLDALKIDPIAITEVPGRMDRLVFLTEDVLSEYAAVESSLVEINHAAFQAATQQLVNSLLSVNRDLVRKAERARFMLSVFSALLLGGVGLIAWRLHQSYRALNRSNQSLELRVAERTNELSCAYEELKESQVQLVQAEKMSSLGALVAGISHEINTPLWYLISNSTVIRDRLKIAKALSKTATTMVSAVQRRENVRQTLNDGLKSMHTLIKDGIEEDLDEAHDLIEDSIQGLNDLTEMAQSLKDFSRLDRAPVGEFDVNEGLDKTLTILKNKIKGRITVHKHYSELPAMTCSPSQINQIFLNLISNAADAINGEGSITISTSHEDDRIVVRIADTGCGIAENVLSKIRDPFFTTKEVGQGTGLGLSIVEKIVNSHNGELRIDSTDGEGSVFSVDFPVGATVRAHSDVEDRAIPGSAAIVSVSADSVTQGVDGTVPTFSTA